MALRRRLRALNAMQEFRSGDRRYRNILLCVTRHYVIQIEMASLSGDKDA